MASLAVRNLFHDRVRLVVTLTGIVFAVVLVAVQAGLFLGFTTTTSNVIDNSGADFWVVSRGVGYLEVAVAVFGKEPVPCPGHAWCGGGRKVHRALQRLEAGRWLANTIARSWASTRIAPWAAPGRWSKAAWPA